MLLVHLAFFFTGVHALSTLTGYVSTSQLCWASIDDEKRC